EYLESWYKRFPGSDTQKKSLLRHLVSSVTEDHLGAVNEMAWWQLFQSRGHQIEPVARAKSSTPDFVHQHERGKTYFEVTTLNVAQNSGNVELKSATKHSVKRVAQKCASDKKQQLLFGYERQSPSVLVVFNYDSWSGYGINHHKAMIEEFDTTKLSESLSAIVFVERRVNSEGVPVFNKQQFNILENDGAKYRYDCSLLENVFFEEASEFPCESKIIQGI
ncbi:hypothetical protein AB6C72_23705, partial [Vibrio splendidus]